MDMPMGFPCGFLSRPRGPCPVPGFSLRFSARLLIPTGLTQDLPRGYNTEELH
jgi:hypothetical protein